MEKAVKVSWSAFCLHACPLPLDPSLPSWSFLPWVLLPTAPKCERDACVETWKSAGWLDQKEEDEGAQGLSQGE
jgi:hypothetical protein